MCWFVTVGIRADRAALVQALDHERDGVGVRPSGNPHLARFFPEGDARFELTRGGCSCEFCCRPRDLGRGDLDKRRRQYRAKGWSEAKIARALAAAESAHATTLPADRASRERARFRRVVAELAAQAGSVRLFAHFYRGSQDEEPVACRGRRWVNANELADADLPEDVLLEVVGGAGRPAARRAWRRR